MHITRNNPQRRALFVLALLPLLAACGSNPAEETCGPNGEPCLAFEPAAKSFALTEPSSPTGLAINFNSGENRLEFTWNASNFGNSIDRHYLVDASGPGLSVQDHRVNDGSTRRYIVQDPAGGNYTFFVQACADVWDEENNDYFGPRCSTQVSKSQTFSTDPFEPPTPGPLTIANFSHDVDTGAFQIEWTRYNFPDIDPDLSQVNYYDVLVNGVVQGATIMDVPNEDSFSRNGSVSASGTYTITIRACYEGLYVQGNINEEISECDTASPAETATFLFSPEPTDAPTMAPVDMSFNGNVTVSWSDSANTPQHVDYYELYVEHSDTGSGGWFEWPEAVISTDTIETLNELPNGFYRFFVIAVNNSGEASASPKSVIYQVDRTPFQPPLGADIWVSDGDPTEGDYTVRWDAHNFGWPEPNLRQYELEIERTPPGQPSTVRTVMMMPIGGSDDVNDRTFGENNQPDGTYRFRVRATHEGPHNPTNEGWSSWSSPPFEVLHPPGVPASTSVPSGLDRDGVFNVTVSSASGSYKTIELHQQVRAPGSASFGNWTAGPTKYIAHNTGSTSFAVDLPDGDYKFKARAVNTSGQSNFTSPSAEILVLALAAPPNSVSTNGGSPYDTDGNFTVSWSASPTGFVEHYELQRGFRPQATGPWSWSSPILVDGLSYNESLSADGYYTYRVRGCNTEETSCASSYKQMNESSAVHVLQTPSAPILTVPPTSESLTYDIHWSGGGAHVDRYETRMRRAGETWPASWTSRALGTSASIQVDDIGDYQHEVRACNVAPGTAHCGAPSATGNVNVILPDDPWAATGGIAFDAPYIEPVVPAGDENVGTLNGSSDVAGGEAVYRIPIQVVPGRKNMQPQISVVYNSNGGNGVLGVGWSLQTGGAIARCGQTAAQDGRNIGVQYDSTRDRLCLNGQRLMRVSGTYGQPGATYRTEQESFALVTQQGGHINDSSSNFVVQYKNGQVATFGSTADSRQSAAGIFAPAQWALHEVSDASGNTISFVYNDFGDGEHHLTSIQYTGYQGADGDRYVVFTYEDREDGTGGRDYYSTYHAGGLTRLTQRLKHIVTAVSGAPVRQYTFDYGEMSLSSQRTLLRGVEECAFGDDPFGTPVCYPPTVFEWNEAEPRYVLEPLGVTLPNGTFERIADGSTRLNDALPHGDINGDGAPDWDVAYANAEGEKTGDGSDALANCYRSPNSFGAICLAGDFDNDGRTDSFRRSSNNTLELRLTAGNTWDDTGIEWGYGGILGEIFNDYPVTFEDFNGDGFTDILMRQHLDNESNPWLRLYVHSGNVQAPFSVATRRDLYEFNIVFEPMNGHYVPVEQKGAQVHGDLNGDGTPDLIETRPPQGSANKPIGMPLPVKMHLIDPVTSMPSTVDFVGGDHLASPEIDASFFMDVNGDGLTDWLKVAPGNNELFVNLNRGGSFSPSDSAWQGLGISVPVQFGTFLVAPDESAVYQTPIMSKIKMMDYDGDGRTDLLLADEVVVGACTEVSYFAGTDSVSTYECNDDVYKSFQTGFGSNQIQGPIDASSKDDSIRRYTVYSFREDATGAIVPSSRPSDIVASATQLSAIDAFGDGLTDVVTVFGCRVTDCYVIDDPDGDGPLISTSVTDANNDPLTEGAYVLRNVGTASGNERYELPDKLRAVTDGLGRISSWIYRPLSSDEYDTGTNDFYAPDHDYINGGDIAATDVEHFHFSSSFSVVAEYQSSHGAACTGADCFNTYRYRYGGATLNTMGRGFQGFRSIVSEQTSKGLKTLSTFRQKFPFVGRLESACTWTTADAETVSNCSTAISQTTSDYHYAEAIPGATHFVAQDLEVVVNRDLDSRAWMGTTREEKTFDAYGNASSSRKTVEDYYGRTIHETNQDFIPDVDNWWLDKLSRTTQTSKAVENRPNQHIPALLFLGLDQDQVTETTYTAWDTTHRLPRETTNEAGVVTITEYSIYGLPRSITTEGTDFVARVTEIDHSVSYGYGVDSVTNAMGHTGSISYDARFGMVTTTTDANSLQTVHTYDAFGRKATTTAPGQPTAAVVRTWCANLSDCEPTALYRESYYQAGAPVRTVDFDAMQREVASATQGFAPGEWIVQSKTYDRFGRVVFASVPHFRGDTVQASKGVRYLAYDALDRLREREKDQTGDAILSTSYLYDGLTADVVAGGLEMSRTYDHHNRLVSTVDASGGTNRYGYDANGNVLVIVDAAGNALRASFDAYNRRTWIDDPNAAEIVYSYDSLGQLLTDATDGDVMRFEYDVLGRRTRRFINETLDSEWFFDGQKKGFLDQEVRYERDGSMHERAFGYDDLSRPWQVTDVIDGDPYTTETHYDTQYGRPKALVYPSGLMVVTDYSETGNVRRQRNGATSYIYAETVAMDVYGNPTVRQFNDGAMEQERSFAPNTGQAESIEVRHSGAARVQKLDYPFYDVFGNLKTQITSHHTTSAVESFKYDDLQRLTQSTRDYSSICAVERNPGSQPRQSFTGTERCSPKVPRPVVVDYAYDAVGNMLQKTDFADVYHYGNDTECSTSTAGPNAPCRTETANGDVRNFVYDGRGNMTYAAGGDSSAMFVSYNRFNKPTSVEASGTTSEFFYGANLSRYRHEKSGPDGNETTHYVSKRVEVVFRDGETVVRHYLGDFGIVSIASTQSNPPEASIAFTFRDRLGSVVTVTDENNVVRERRGFDPFGKPRNGDWWEMSTPTLASETSSRGFTDHEHLDAQQLIHMNGRIFDFNLGRFYSVDPFIASMRDTQAINPYSYIGNNPLSGVDPSGYQAAVESYPNDDYSDSKPGSHLRRGYTENGSNNGSTTKLPPLVILTHENPHTGMSVWENVKRTGAEALCNATSCGTARDALDAWQEGKAVAATALTVLLVCELSKACRAPDVVKGWGMILKNTVGKGAAGVFRRVDTEKAADAAGPSADAIEGAVRSLDDKGLHFGQDFVFQSGGKSGRHGVTEKMDLINDPSATNIQLPGVNSRGVMYEGHHTAVGMELSGEMTDDMVQMILNGADSSRDYYQAVSTVNVYGDNIFDLQRSFTLGD